MDSYFVNFLYLSHNYPPMVSLLVSSPYMKVPRQDFCITSALHMVDFIYMQEVLVIQVIKVVQVIKAIQAIHVKKYKFMQALQVMQVRLAHMRLNFRVIYCERVG